MDACALRCSSLFARLGYACHDNLAFCSSFGALVVRGEFRAFARSVVLTVTDVGCSGETIGGTVIYVAFLELTHRDGDAAVALVWSLKVTQSGSGAMYFLERDVLLSIWF